MPYIDDKTKEQSEVIDINTPSLDVAITRLAGVIRYGYNDDQIEGVMNYVITRLICQVFGGGGWRYKFINRAIGVLECVKLEFYRRLAGPYEDKAIAKNGDVREYTNP